MHARGNGTARRITHLHLRYPGIVFLLWLYFLVFEFSCLFGLGLRTVNEFVNAL